MKKTLPRPFSWKPRAGEEFANRARYHIHRLMTRKKLPISGGLKCAAPRTLTKFINGESDMTITMLENVAEELGTSLPAMFRPRPIRPEPPDA